MKFFLDENVSPLVADPVAKVYRRFEFRTANGENLRGVPDVELFEDLRQRDYHVIITKDARQLREEDGERAALRQAGLHWVGLLEPDAHGVDNIAVLAGALLAAFPHIVPELGPTPCAFHIAVDRLAGGMVADSYPL